MTFQIKYVPPSPVSNGARGKLLNLSVKQRALLHGLLHRDLRKCSMSTLTACHRSGWISGEGAGYQLTAQGRHVAELSEQAPADQTLELDFS